MPRQLARRHLIEVLLHTRGESVIQKITETVLESLGDNVTHFFSVKALVLEPDVAAILDSGDDRGIGRWTPYSAFFELAHQAGLGIARRRLGEVLARFQLHQFQHISLRDIGQNHVLAFASSRRQYSRVTVEADNTAARSQLEVFRGHGNCCRRVLRRRHLAGDELAPDQFVKPLGIALHTRQLGLGDIHVRRADGLVGFLSAVFGGIHARCLWQVS